jgi:PAS domain S-box-containing protein
MLLSHALQKKISLSSFSLKFAGGIFCYFITAVFMFFIPLTGAQVQKETIPAQLTALEKEWVASHSVVRIAPDPHFPPIESIDNNGKYEGIAAEFMQVLQKATGINFKVIRCKNWDEVLEKAKSVEVDALPAVALTPERSKYLLYSAPHIVLPGVIITRANVKKAVTLKDLSAMRVSIVQSYVWQEFLEADFPDIQLDLVPDLKTALKKVAMGISDAVVATLPVALYYIEKEGITNLRVAGETGYYTRLSFATRRDWPELNAIVNKALSQIPQSEKNKILRKWIHLEGTSIFKNKVFWFILIGFIGICGLILLAVVMWNKSLRSVVSQRTAQLSRELAERKQAEEKLKKSEAMLESIFQASPLGVGLVQNGKMQWHNETMSRMLGYTSAEIDGKNARMLCASVGEFERAEGAINTLGPDKKTIGIETRWARKDGSVFDCHVRYSLLDAESKDSAVLTIAEDITARKKAEEERKNLEVQLQQAQKMEAIGSLAGGIAHDFNNLLMGIQGRTSLMMIDKDSSYPDFEHLEGIGHYVKSAADLTRQLLGFARAGKYEVKSTDINEMIKKSARMFGRTKKEINIHTTYQKNVWTIEIDRGQIEQVLMNLYVNAWQAMPDGGELSLKTKNVILDDGHEKRFKIAPADMLKYL